MMFLSLFLDVRKPKIVEFILNNIFIIGIITFAVLVILAIVKLIEYRDAKKDKKK
jgi:heme/copper-type cytochrome/quinol oxidase subunit 2